MKAQGEKQLYFKQFGFMANLLDSALPCVVHIRNSSTTEQSFVSFLSVSKHISQ